MNKISHTKDVKIIIDCNEVINLFLHTLNIYGLLSNHGTDYKLRQDEKVNHSIDKTIEEDVKQGDRYFSYGKLKVYETGMNYILKNNIWKNPIDSANIHMKITEKNFNLALIKSWNTFYKDYWNSTLSDRQVLFNECINAFDFLGNLEKMVLAVHRDLTSDFYIFPAEALVHSGLKYNDNVCMGALHIGDDMGFVHEGLHLLLNEEWADNNEIKQILKKSSHEVKYYHSFIAKYEQALVVGLDCCIKDKDDSMAENYHKGCCVDDIFDISYPIIKEYYYNGCNESIEKLMLKIVSLCRI